MTSYGQGGVILAASVLPATSALGFVFINHANPAIVVGFLLISALSFVNLMAQVSRFVVNIMKNK